MGDWQEQSKLRCGKMKGMGHTHFDSNCEEQVNCEPGYSLHGMVLGKNMGI